VADPYAGVRYGCGSFRDFNAIVSGYNSQDIRTFFKDMLLRNCKFHPEVLNEDNIKTDFDHFDKVFESRNDKDEDYKFVVEQPPQKLEITSRLL